MITATEIAAVHPELADDFAETQGLIARFAELRIERLPFYLTADEFGAVLCWKLRDQLGRQQVWRAGNTDKLIRSVTGLALSVSHCDLDYEQELRVSLLCALRGVGVPVASAVLALVMPEQYGVIDFRGWRQLFGEERRGFGVADYRRYMVELRRLARQLGRTPQEIDFAIWVYDGQQSRAGAHQGR